MIKIKYTKHYERKIRSNKVEYSTAAGMYCVIHDVKVTFCMLKFPSSKIIIHCFHVDNNKDDSIIGRDLMVQLVLTADFKRQLLQWDGATMHMKKPRSFLGKYDVTKRDMRKVVMQSTEPASTQESTEQMVKVLYSKYAKAERKQVANNATQLNSDKITLLLSLLKDFEDLFGGTLGDGSTENVDLEINPYSKQFISIYYPAPRINKEPWQKELKLLVEIGVLNTVQQSQYGTPIFIINNKEGTVRFMTYYFRINQQCIRNPYPLPIIGETIQKLEVFQYVTALYLNMRYYTIRLLPTSQGMTKIFTESGKFRYNRLPMGMYTSGHIFLFKVDGILGDIEGVKTYIGDILVFSKDRF